MKPYFEYELTALPVPASAAKATTDISVSAIKLVQCNQQCFLANKTNKSQLIQILIESLQRSGHKLIQAQEDADTTIVSVAVTIAASRKSVRVVADDTDVLVMLVHHFKQEGADIYMMSDSEARKGHSVPIRDIQRSIGDEATRQLLVIHAISGCDTTSALFGVGETSCYKKLTSSSSVTATLTNTIMKPDSGQDDVGKTGMQLLVHMYGGKNGDSLNRRGLSNSLLRANQTSS